MGGLSWGNRIVLDLSIADGSESLAFNSFVLAVGTHVLFRHVLIQHLFDHLFTDLEDDRVIAG